MSRNVLPEYLVRRDIIATSKMQIRSRRAVVTAAAAVAGVGNFSSIFSRLPSTSIIGVAFHKSAISTYKTLL